MCTDKTLRDKIRKLNEANEAIKAAEAIKKKLSAEIIEECDIRGVDVFGGVRVITRAQDRADTAMLKAEYPQVWDVVKKRTVSRYLGKAAAK